MLRTTTPNCTPVIAPQDSAEVFMLHFVALQTGNDTLRAKAGRYLEAVVEQVEPMDPLQFMGDEAILLLDGLSRVVHSMPETEWRHAQAKLMLERPEPKDPALPTYPQLSLVPGAVNN